MKNLTLISGIYTFVLLLNLLLSIFRWRQLSAADRFIAVLLSVTTITELVAREMGHRNINNLLLYRAYNSVGTVLTALYFHRCVFAQLKSNTKWIALGVSIAFAISALFLIPINAAGNGFSLLINATIVIALCLFSVRQILLKMDTLPYRHVQFWLTCLFLFYSSLTFTGWGTIYSSTSIKEPVYILFFTLLICANVGLYSATALILFFYKKLIPSGE